MSSYRNSTLIFSSLISFRNFIIMEKKTLLFITLTFALIACNSDTHYQDSSTTANHNFLKVGNKRVQLESGSLQNLGSFRGDVSDFVLNLFSSDFKISNGKPKFEDDVISGVSMDLYVNSSSNNLETTSYEKVSFKNIRGNSFEALNVAVNYDFANQEGTTRYITNGILNVYNTGSNYELEFSGTDNEGEKVIFFYEGKLSKPDSTEF